MNVIVTEKDNKKFHYDDIKEIHFKDWSCLMAFDKDGHMYYNHVSDIIKVEIVIEENKQFLGKLAVFNE